MGALAEYQPPSGEVVTGPEGEFWQVNGDALEWGLSPYGKRIPGWEPADMECYHIKQGAIDPNEIDLLDERGFRTIRWIRGMRWTRQSLYSIQSLRSREDS